MTPTTGNQFMTQKNIKNNDVCLLHHGESEVCPECHGTGAVNDNTCSSCNGKGIIGI